MTHSNWRSGSVARHRFQIRVTEAHLNLYEFSECTEHVTWILTLSPVPEHENLMPLVAN
jgi:hypothetical protein